MRDTGEMYQLGEDLNQRVYEARVALLRIRERVLNDELRHELTALQEFATEIEMLKLKLRGAAVDEPSQSLTPRLPSSLNNTYGPTRFWTENCEWFSDARLPLRLEPEALGSACFFVTWSF